MKIKKSKNTNIVNLGGGSLLLGSLALISLGFSSWVLVTSNTSKSANIAAAAVVDGILFKDANMTTFSLCQDGIVGTDENGNPNGTVVESANVTITFTINNDACDTLGYLNDNNELTIQTTLGSYPSSSTSSFLNYISTPNVTLNPVGDSSVAVQSEDVTGYVHFITVTLDPTKEETKLTLSYPVSFPINDNIGSSVVSYYNTNLKFSFSAKGIKESAS